MGMPASAIYHSADMVRAMPDDGNRYETVYGELLVTPSPRNRHQNVLGRLYLAVGNYLAGEGLEGALFSPSDISWGADTLVQPDLYVVDVRLVRSPGWTDTNHLLLAVEVLSPSSIRADRFIKRRLYQEQGVPAYWVVDADARQVEVWSPDAAFPIVERERLVWRHPEAAQDVTINLPTLFRPSRLDF